MTLSKNWSDLIQSSVKTMEMSADGKNGVFSIEPLERGFGMTLGAALRRVLLSSLQGHSIVGVKIDGVLHEFSSIPGVVEDVVDVVLNLKKVILKLDGIEKKQLSLRSTGPGVVTAGMIEKVYGVTVVNPDQKICTLERGGEINMQLFCGSGRGYVSANQEDSEGLIGYIPIDAVYSPVLSVAYKVDNMRIGQLTNYNKLTISIETNGVLHPRTALGLAARIMQEQCQSLIDFEDERVVQKQVEVELGIDKNLLRKIDELELSVRSQNCLRSESIVYIGDLVSRSEADMLRTPNFGRKSLNEIKELLSVMGLKFGMEIPGWPLADIAELSKKYEEPFR